uniref:PapAB n=1 Tax=Bacillus pumilus TaxID=1408 RepID=A0A386YGE0_BACPU|nr:PapAB [Bacillus pumilus]
MLKNKFGGASSCMKFNALLLSIVCASLLIVSGSSFVIQQDSNVSVASRKAT